MRLCWSAFNSLDRRDDWHAVGDLHRGSSALPDMGNEPTLKALAFAAVIKIKLRQAISELEIGQCAQSLCGAEPPLSGSHCCSMFK